MLRAVIRVEWLSTMRERSVWIILAAFVPLVAYAAMNAGTFVRGEALAIAAAERDDAGRIAKLRRRLRAIGAGAAARAATDPRDPLLVGRDLAPRAASWPLGPLAVVSIGQRDLLPSTVLLTARSSAGDSGSPEPSSPTARAAGPFDLAFVFVVLLPLLVIALSYDLVSGERERGTLALVLSQPLSLGTFVLGKALQRASLVLVVVLTLGLVAPVVAGARPFDGDGLLCTALYAALLVGYVAFWFCAALAVNAFGRSSAGNALILVGAWLALVVVVPGLATVAIDTLHPPPSRVALVNLAREVQSTAEAQAAAIEGDHGRTDRPGVDRSSRRFVEVQGRLRRDVAPVLRQFRDQLDAQQRLVDVLRFLSPAIVMSEGLNEVAGSSVRGHQHFSAQLDRHHLALQRFYFDRIRRGATLRATDYDAMPRFAYVASPVGELLLRVLSSLAGLVLLSALLLGVAWKGLTALEIDVR